MMPWVEILMGMYGAVGSIAILCLIVVIWRLWMIFPTYLLAMKREWVPHTDEVSLEERNASYVMNINVIIGLALGLIGLIINEFVPTIWTWHVNDWPHKLMVFSNLIQYASALFIIRSISFSVCGEWGWLTMGALSSFIGLIIGFTY